MPDATVRRTLVKSPPELWAELSDVSALARHLGEFGDIRITRTDPETTVAWEGDRACGTVEIESSGWGTKVTLTATPTAGEEPPVREPAPEEPPPADSVEAPVAEDAGPPWEEPEPAAAPEPEAAPALAPVAERPGFFARLFGRRPRPVVEPRVEIRPAAPAPVAPAPVAVEKVPEPVAVAEPEPEPEPASEPEPVAVALEAERIEEILASVLDDLGAAHHRPFSR